MPIKTDIDFPAIEVIDSAAEFLKIVFSFQNHIMFITLHIFSSIKKMYPLLSAHFSILKFLLRAKMKLISVDE